MLKTWGRILILSPHFCTGEPLLYSSVLLVRPGKSISQSSSFTPWFLQALANIVSLGVGPAGNFGLSTTFSGYNCQEAVWEANWPMGVAPSGKGQVLKATVVCDGDIHSSAQLLVQVQHLHCKDQPCFLEAQCHRLELTVGNDCSGTTSDPDSYKGTWKICFK